MNPPSVLQTPGFAHYSLAWSPFYNTRLALASSANFGLVGNGRLHIVSLVPGPGGLTTLKLDKLYVHSLLETTRKAQHSSFESQDGLYDLAWSEVHENHVLTASGDGSIRLWDVMLDVRRSVYAFQCLADVYVGPCHRNLAGAYKGSILGGLV